MIYLLNSFSLNMLGEIDNFVVLRFTRFDIDDAKRLLEEGFESAVGHESTAKILSNMLGVDVQCNRTTVRLRNCDEAIVAQYIGPRLPEGATELPPGTKIEFFAIDFLK